jgi:hypothetical protein
VSGKHRPISILSRFSAQINSSILTDWIHITDRVGVDNARSDIGTSDQQLYLDDVPLFYSSLYTVVFKYPWLYLPPGRT